MFQWCTSSPKVVTKGSPHQRRFEERPELSKLCTQVLEHGTQVQGFWEETTRSRCNKLPYEGLKWLSFHGLTAAVLAALDPRMPVLHNHKSVGPVTSRKINRCRPSDVANQEIVSSRKPQCLQASSPGTASLASLKGSAQN